MFVLPLPWTTGLVDPPLDLVSIDGSETYWEIGKAIRQALRADPNTLEMLCAEPHRGRPDGRGAGGDARGLFVAGDLRRLWRYALSQLDRLEHNQRLAEHRTVIIGWIAEDPALEARRGGRAARRRGAHRGAHARRRGRAREGLHQAAVSIALRSGADRGERLGVAAAGGGGEPRAAARPAAEERVQPDPAPRPGDPLAARRAADRPGLGRAAADAARGQARRGADARRHGARALADARASRAPARPALAAAPRRGSRRAGPARGPGRGRPPLRRRPSPAPGAPTPPRRRGSLRRLIALPSGRERFIRPLGVLSRRRPPSRDAGSPTASASAGTS